jgi:hypothetical protein
MNDMLGMPSRTVVVSDSQYKEMQQNQARLEIKELEKTLLTYESRANRLRSAIADLQKEHNLLPEASE